MDLSWTDIHGQLSQNLPDGILARDLTQMYEDRNIPIILRRKYGAWFESQNWPDTIDMETASDRYRLLIDTLTEDIAKVKEENVYEAVELARAEHLIKEAYGADPIGLVRAVTVALDSERTMVSRHRPQPMDQGQDETKDVPDKYNFVLETLKRDTEHLVTIMTHAVSHLTCSEQIREELKSIEIELQEVTQNAQLNGNRAEISRMYKERCKEKTLAIENHVKEFQKARQELKDKMKELAQTVQELKVAILAEVKTFLNIQKLAYVRAECPEKMNTMLKQLHNWCGDLGQCCWKLLQHTKDPNFREVMSRSYSGADHPPSPTINIEDNDEMNSVSSELKQVFTELLKGTFIVVTQPPELLKMVSTKNKGNSRGDINVKVGILALNNLHIEQISSKVMASFRAESDIAGGFTAGRRICNLENSEAQFKSIGRTAEACYDNLKVTEFSRGRDNDDNSRVSKQFYRLVFNTTVTLQSELVFDLETMSLPMIVNTGSNQACEAHGSLLWYCYNINDMYEPRQLIVPSELPLDQVLDMLNACLRAISPRELKEDERKFLGEKLTGKSVKKPADASHSTPMVTFHQFCVNKMKQNRERPVEFSFWKWFQAVINLINKFLKEPWKDGVIKGFISKSVAQKVLKPEPPGTFLIRFSESCVNGDHQGVTGGIVIVLQHERVGVTFSQPQVEANLSRVPLATILKSFINQRNGERLLVTLFKSRISKHSREETFKKYESVQSDKSDQYNSGYPSWVTFLGLEDTFAAMQLADIPATNNDIWTVDQAMLSQTQQQLRAPRPKRPRKPSESVSSQAAMDSSCDSNCSNIPTIVQDFQVKRSPPPPPIQSDVAAFLRNFAPTPPSLQPIHQQQQQHPQQVQQLGQGAQFSLSQPNQYPPTTIMQSFSDALDMQPLIANSPSMQSTASSHDSSLENTHSPSSHLSSDLEEIEPSVLPGNLLRLLESNLPQDSMPQAGFQQNSAQQPGFQQPGFQQGTFQQGTFQQATFQQQNVQMGNFQPSDFQQGNQQLGSFQ